MGAWYKSYHAFEKPHRGASSFKAERGDGSKGFEKQPYRSFCKCTTSAFGGVITELTIGGLGSEKISCNSTRSTLRAGLCG
jgi:hypothetical protein